MDQAPAKKVGYHIKDASFDDMQNILSMSKEFFTESNYNGFLTFSEEKLKNHLYMAWGEWPRSFVTKIINFDNEPIGYAHVQYDSIFTVENVGNLYQFYIRQGNRGGIAARILRDAVDDQFEQWDCRIRYAECGAGLDAKKNNMIFSNLWSKIGFEFLGTALYKRG